jgi:hypothetical protein
VFVQWTSRTSRFVFCPGFFDGGGETAAALCRLGVVLVESIVGASPAIEAHIPHRDDEVLVQRMESSVNAEPTDSVAAMVQETHEVAPLVAERRCNTRALFATAALLKSEELESLLAIANVIIRSFLRSIGQHSKRINLLLTTAARFNAGIGTEATLRSHAHLHSAETAEEHAVRIVAAHVLMSMQEAELVRWMRDVEAAQELPRESPKAPLLPLQRLAGSNPLNDC